METVRESPRIHFIPFVRSLASTWQGNVLDVGCGTTVRYRSMLPSSIHYTGIDILDNESDDPAYIRMDAQRLTFAPDYFDAIICIETLEHISHPSMAIGQMARVLRPHGTLLLTVPTRWTWVFEFGRHGHYFSLQELCQLFETNFTLTAVFPRGGIATYLLSLCKSWITIPMGVLLRIHPQMKIFWRFIDRIFYIPFLLARAMDDHLPIPTIPITYVMVFGKRPSPHLSPQGRGTI